MNDDTYQEVYQDEPVTVKNLGGIDMGKEWETGCTVNREDKMDCMCAKEDGKVAYKDESTQRYIDSLKKEVEKKSDEVMKLCREIDAMKMELDEKNKLISEFEASLHRVNEVKDEEINRLKEENKKLEGLLSTAYSMFGELFELARKEK